MKVYGIPNCDTVKKARTWLTAHQIDYEFHDFKKLGISREKLEEWSSKIDWEVLLNKRGTTWRKIEPEQQALITSRDAAIDLMQVQTSVIKRPVIEVNGQLTVGFDEAEYERRFGNL